MDFQEFYHCASLELADGCRDLTCAFLGGIWESLCHCREANKRRLENTVFGGECFFLFFIFFCCEWPSRGAIGRGMTLMSFCGDDHVGVLWCLIILEWLLHKGCLSTTGVTWQMSLLWHWSRMNILLWRMKTKWVVRRTTYDANVLRGALHFEQTKSMEWHWFEGSVKMARCPFYDWPWHPESWSVHVTCCKYVCVPRDKYVCTASCVSSVQHDTCSKDVNSFSLSLHSMQHDVNSFLLVFT